MPELDPMKRRLTWTVYDTPLMTLTTLLQTWACPYVSLCSSMSNGDWDLFLGPQEWARAETGGADR